MAPEDMRTEHERASRLSVPCLAGTLVGTAANGQIYVGWDEQGERVLSDRPFAGATRTHSLPVGGHPSPIRLRR